MAKKKLLLAALLVGGLAALLMALFAKQKNEETEAVLGNQVYVVKAARSIAAGTPLTPDVITTELVPEKFLPPNPIMKKDIDIYISTPLAVNVQEGAMILTSDFAVAEVSRDLSSKIPAGERAMSVPVDAISGISGLLTPGDRVDVLGTFPVTDKDELVPDAQGQDSVGFVTMTLLQNVTLLAVGRQLSNVGQSDNREGIYNTVTMSLTVAESELLTIAQTRGKLMLLLRNREDVDVAAVTRQTLRQVLKDLELIQEVRNTNIAKKRPVKKVEKTGIVVDTGSNR